MRENFDSTCALMMSRKVGVRIVAASDSATSWYSLCRQVNFALYLEGFVLFLNLEAINTCIY